MWYSRLQGACNSAQNRQRIRLCNYSMSPYLGTFLRSQVDPSHAFIRPYFIYGCQIFECGEATWQNGRVPGGWFNIKISFYQSVTVVEIRHYHSLIPTVGFTVLVRLLFILNQDPGACFRIKMSPYQCMNYHYKDKTVARPPYLYNGNNHTWKDHAYI